MKRLIETRPKVSVAIQHAGSACSLNATGWLRLRTACATTLLPLLLLTLPATVRAQYDYTTNNGTITITGYPGHSGAVTIPAIITGAAGHQYRGQCLPQ